jgi:hypothetical protein
MRLGPYLFLMLIMISSSSFHHWLCDCDRLQQCCVPFD